MTTVICVKCDECGRLGTKDMKWIKQDDGKEEVLLCVCGNRQWKFVEKAVDFITSDVLVVNR